MRSDEKVIRIAAAVILNDSGETLLVRKRGTSAFMQAGGKFAEGEAALEALAREIGEELGCGSIRSRAARSDFVVEAELYAVRLSGEAGPRGEIEEAVWVDPAAPLDLVLAPLTRAHALTLARSLAPPILSDGPDSV